MNQNNLEYLSDQVFTGKMTADKANIEKVRMNRVLLVIAPLSMAVRKALNSAVKIGYLAHLKKEPYLPEVYYHPDFKYMAIKERNDYSKRVLNSIKGCLI